MIDPADVQGGADMTLHGLARLHRMHVTDTRRDVTSTEHTPCPHCGANQEDSDHFPADHVFDDPGPWDCLECGKAFMFDVTDGGTFQTVALETQADWEYRQQMASRGATSKPEG